MALGAIIALAIIGFSAVGFYVWWNTEQSDNSFGVYQLLIGAAAAAAAAVIWLLAYVRP
jgi:hypothetical protein